MIQKADSLQKVILRVDTLYIDRVDPKITEQYLNILSDTNAQLNSSYTPLVISITILTALIGLGAIAAGYFIWRQGKDFKDRQNSILEELSESKNEFLSIAGSIKNKEEEFNTILDDVKNSILQQGDFNTAQTTTIETTINDAAEKVKKDFQFSSTLKYIVTCGHCHKKYPFELSSRGSITTQEMAKKIFTTTCPFCEFTQINNQKPVTNS